MALATTTRQIVTFVESMCTGRKFEKLISNHYTRHEQNVCEHAFMFDNGTFFALQKRVEQRAHNQGIPVIYVNPAYTSKHCCHCEKFGRRVRKLFECPHCGYIVHADVIATMPIRCTTPELFAAEEERAFLLSKKQMRRIVKAEARRRSALTPTPTGSRLNMAARENLLAVPELG